MCGADVGAFWWWAAGAGLIPACAGQTEERYYKIGEDGAHPRVCGADGSTSSKIPLIRGSSPRVRGRHPPSVCCGAGPGLIPACAGQTNFRDMSLEYDRAHPRVCGADRCLNSFDAHLWGSSPRVRGRPFLRATSWTVGGLIPACAGQTNTVPK